jgi:PncC family amidohydrolase
VPPNDDELLREARRVGAACRERGATLATAESCTGGLVAHLITEIPGSSGYFVGGAVTYSNDVKAAIVDVPETLLATYGAVSAQVAVAMAEGVRRRLGVDLGVAVTGIAGPDGGTAEKPVGLTYVAVADVAGHEVRRFHWDADRSGNKRESAAAALALAAERLEATTA